MQSFRLRELHLHVEDSRIAAAVDKGSRKASLRDTLDTLQVILSLFLTVPSRIGSEIQTVMNICFL